MYVCNSPVNRCHFASAASCLTQHDERRGTNLLLLACQAGSAACVEELIARCHASVSCTNLHGDTPLHVAAGEGFLHVVELLIDRFGADATALDNVRSEHSAALLP